MPEVNPVPPVPVPRVVSHKRTAIIIVAIIGLVAIVVALGAGTYVLLRRNALLAQSGVSPSVTPEELSVGGSIEQQFGTVDPSTPLGTLLPTTSPLASSGSNPIPLPVDAIPTQLIYLDQSLQNNIGVTLHFTRTPAFTLAIERLTRTYEEPNLFWYAPKPGQPYSTLRLLDTTGVVSEGQLFVSSTNIAETFDQPPIITDLTEGTLYVVLSVPANKTPHRLEIVNPTGTVMVAQDINYEGLPEQPPAGTELTTHN